MRSSQEAQQFCCMSPFDLCRCNICWHLVLGFDIAFLAVDDSKGSDLAPGVASQWVSFKDLGQDFGREKGKEKKKEVKDPK